MGGSVGAASGLVEDPPDSLACAGCLEAFSAWSSTIYFYSVLGSASVGAGLGSASVGLVGSGLACSGSSSLLNESFSPFDSLIGSTG